MIDCSIIIVNYKSESLVSECVKSIKKNVVDISYEIILVDNASPNNSFQKLENEYNFFDNVHCLRIEENVGFGRANNAGYTVANGRNIFCLNPDTELINNAVKILCDFLDNHTDIGVCGGNLYHRDMKMCTSYRRIYPSIFWEFSTLLFYLPERIIYGKKYKFNKTGDNLEVAYITGADLMIKRKVIDKVGFFNPDFFMYYEDSELCFRVRKNGYRIYNVPTSKIYHLEGKSTDNYAFKAKINCEGRKTFFRHCYSNTYYQIANFLFILVALSRTILLFMIGRGSYKYWWNIFKYSLR